MQDMIERLIRCGIPETTAVKVCADFIRRGKLAALIDYVRTEEEARGMA